LISYKNAIREHGRKKMMISSSSHKFKALKITAFLLTPLCLFVVWLCIFSSVLPLGFSEMTDQIDPAWSPSGKLLAFECHYSYPLDGYDFHSFDNPNFQQETGEICFWDLETHEVSRITYGRHKTHPVWSPDGSKLAWLDDRFGLEMYNLRSRTKSSKIDFQYYPVENLDDFYFSPSQLLTIQFTKPINQDNQNGFSFIVRRNGEKVFQGDFPVSPYPKWSPDESILVLKKARVNDNQQEIIFISLLTQETTSVIINHPVYEIAWSPIDDKVAFASDEVVDVLKFKFNNQPFSYQVVQHQTFQINKIKNSFTEGELLWSPDSTYIAIVTYSSEEIFNGDPLYEPAKIWLLDTKNANLRQLTGTP
jgi:dipeptidyl aminopeptidase/acylaminoacyl peptidase